MAGMWWAVPLAVLSLLGLVLAVVGVRGRRVGTHPTCGRCGFDLYGGTLAGGRCNECGRELVGRRAVRIGHRRRRPWLVALGVVALLPGLLAVGVMGYILAAGVDWQTHKPGWWLVRELKDADPKVVDAAVGELGRRGDYALLDDKTALAGVDALLDVQGDVARPWHAAWGDWIEARHAAGAVGDDRMKRYYRQALVPTLRVRPHVRRGEPLPAAFELTTRGGSAGGLVMVEWRGESFRVGDVDVVAAARQDAGDSVEPATGDDPDGNPYGMFGDDSPDTNAGVARAFGWQRQTYLSPASPPEPLPILPGEATARLAPGRHTATLRLSLSADFALLNAMGRTGRRNSSVASTEASDFVVTAEVEVDAADAPQWRVATDAETRRKIEAGVEVSTVRRQSWGGGRHQLQVYVRDLPTAVFWDVELRPSAGDAGEAVPGDTYGGLGFAAGTIIFGNVGFAKLPSPEATRVDVVLLPRTAHLLPRIDPPTAWGRPVVIPNVPVAPNGPRHGVAGPR